MGACNICRPLTLPSPPKTGERVQESAIGVVEFPHPQSIGVVEFPLPQSIRVPLLSNVFALTANALGEGAGEGRNSGPPRTSGSRRDKLARERRVARSSWLRGFFL